MVWAPPCESVDTITDFHCKTKHGRKRGKKRTWLVALQVGLGVRGTNNAKRYTRQCSTERNKVFAEESEFGVMKDNRLLFEELATSGETRALLEKVQLQSSQASRQERQGVPFVDQCTRKSDEGRLRSSDIR